MKTAALIIAFAIIALIIVLGSARSQTEEERAACTSDAIKFCQNDIPRGIIHIKACLRAHRGQISQECADVLARRKL